MPHSYSHTVKRILASPQTRYALPENAPGQTLLVRQHFNVASETPRLQGPAWTDYVGRILDVSIPRRYQSEGFFGELDTYVMKDLIFLDSRTGPVSQTRSSARISADGMRDYCFHVAVEGIIETVTGSFTQRKSEQFVPGILALDMNQRMRMVRPSYARVLAFFLPRALVEAQIPDAESLHGRVITYTSPLTRMILDHLTILCRELPKMPADAVEHAIRSCADLVLAAFSKQQKLDHKASAAARTALLFQVQHYVNNHLRDVQLTPEQIQLTFKLSRPTLYRLFEREGGLASYIRNCRLRAAAADLIDMPQLSIMAVAFDLGFGSPSDFTRAFRRAYGISPQDFRGMGLESGLF